MPVDVLCRPATSSTSSSTSSPAIELRRRQGCPSLSSTAAILPLRFGLNLGDPDLGSLVVVEHKLAEDDVDLRALTTRDFSDVAHDRAIPGPVHAVGAPHQFPAGGRKLVVGGSHDLTAHPVDPPGRGGWRVGFPA